MGSTAHVPPLDFRLIFLLTSDSISYGCLLKKEHTGLLQEFHNVLVVYPKIIVF